MTWPVPSEYPISTPYGKRGSYWSCNKDSSGNGVHTGDDFAAPEGTEVYATIDGQIRHRNYGSAFGSHQFAISPDPGQPFEDGEVFYAHTYDRPKDGTYVKAGDLVAHVGLEGNTTGAHLHYEFHPSTKGSWSCSVHADPAPTLEGDSTMAQDVYNYEYSGKSDDIKPIALNEYVWVTKDTDDPAASGLEFKLVYLNVRLTWKGEGFGNIRVKFVREGDDPTAYQDFLVHSSQTEFLITHNHMELGEKGIGGKWYIKVTGAALASAAVGTRYNKYATIKDRG